MTRRRTMLTAPAGLLMAVALAALTLPTSAADAQGSCSSSCRAAYGACYTKSQDRSKCQAQLKRCPESCIKSKR